MIIGQPAVALLLGSLAARIPVTGYAYQWCRGSPTPSSADHRLDPFTFLAIVVVAVDYTVVDGGALHCSTFTGTPATAFLITAGVLLLQALCCRGCPMR